MPHALLVALLAASPAAKPATPPPAPVAAPAPTPPPAPQILKIAVMPLETGDGIAEKTAGSVTEYVVSEVRRRPFVSVVTPREMQAVITLERQKQMMGCAEDSSCLAEIASALGVDRLLIGNLSKLGASWLLHLKLVDASKATTAAQSDRRLKDKSIDDVLDTIPAMVSELFGGAALATARAAANPTRPALAVDGPASDDKLETTVSTAFPAPAKKPATAGLDEPYDLGKLKSQLVVLTDGKNYLAVVPFGGSDAPFFAGDGKSFYAQRVYASGSSGFESFSLSFWDPRLRSGWEHALNFKRQPTSNDPEYFLQCGEEKVAYRPVSKSQAASMVEKAKFFKPRWRRIVHALVRDDAGTYFYVDEPRDEKQAGKGWRLFAGVKGGLSELDLVDVLRDSGGEVLVTRAGRLKISGTTRSAEWIHAAGRTKLVYLPLEPADVQMIYSDLGVYAGDPLRTACDPHL